MPVYLGEYAPDKSAAGILAEENFPATAYRSQVRRSPDGILIYPNISSCMAVGFVDNGPGIIGVHLTVYQCGDIQALEKCYVSVHRLLNTGISSIYMAGIFHDRLAQDFFQSEFGCAIYASKLNDLKLPMDITFTRNGPQIIGTCDQYKKGNLPFELR